MKHNKTIDVDQLMELMEKREKSLFKEPVPQINDHMDLADKYLNDAAKAALKIKSYKLEETYDRQIIKAQDGTGDDEWTKETAVCQYFGCIVRKDKIEEGVKAISEAMNQLADMGAIYSCLAPVSSVDLALKAYQHQTCAVLSYVLIRPEFTDIAKTNRFNIQEGEIEVEELHNLDMELFPGEFFALIHINKYNLASTTKEAIIYNEIESHIKALPKGTEFIGYRELPCVDSVISYELKFYNPLFTEIKQVQLHRSRAVANIKYNPTGKDLVQFNLLSSIEYIYRRDNL